MAPRKKPTKNGTGKRPIEQYDHNGKKCVDIPPVGIMTPQTDPHEATRNRHFDRPVFAPLANVDEGTAKSGPDLEAEIDPELTGANRGVERLKAVFLA